MSILDGIVSESTLLLIYAIGFVITTFIAAAMFSSYSVESLGECPEDAFGRGFKGVVCGCFWPVIVGVLVCMLLTWIPGKIGEILNPGK